MAFRRLYWDIETVHNIVAAFRGGMQFLSHKTILMERVIYCICYKWEGEKKVHTLRWKDKRDGKFFIGCDRKMLQEFTKVAAEADEMVAHFGDKFDLKFFNTRHLYHQLPPIPIYKTVDTKAIAARRFLFNSNKLDYIANFLGYGCKDKTDIDLWLDIIVRDCPKAKKYMEKYCARDVKLLEKVFKRMEPYHRPKTHAGVFAGGEKWHCPYCGGDHVVGNKKKVTTLGTIQHEMICRNDKCQKYFTISHKAYTMYQDAKKASH